VAMLLQTAFQTACTIVFQLHCGLVDDTDATKLNLNIQIQFYSSVAEL